VSHLLVRDPYYRYTADQMLNHPWIQNSVPATFLDTPRILSRNNSSQYLDQQIADTKMVFDRIMLAKISQSLSSLSSTDSNPFFPSDGAESPRFTLGDFSDDEDWQPKPVKKTESQSTLQLNLPSSKLAQRRMSSRHI